MQLRKVILLPLAIVLLASCHPDTPDFLASDTLASSERAIMDSALVPKEFKLTATQIDSLLRVNADIPKPVDLSYYSPVAVTQFSMLASKTSGQTYFLADSRKISQEILRIIDQHLEASTDLVFLIDNTGSMEDDIDNVTKAVASIIDKLAEKPGVRIAIASYGDKNEDPGIWFQKLDFTSDFTQAKTFMNGIKMTGGGDDPESVFDGAARMMDELEWRNDSKKMILLLGDAPGLLPPLSRFSLEDIVLKSKSHGVLMNYYPVIISPLSGGIQTVPTFKETPMINTVYPVPTTGPVNVLMNEAGNYDYELYDLSGKLLMSGKCEESDNFQLDLSGQDNGAYLLRLINPVKKKFEQQKIILNK
ncbi:MAG: VWA domain-containing protein [Bacteroidota bacterium]|nr:VWA domain-containing protein [Bacteroidota bacterium]